MLPVWIEMFHYGGDNMYVYSVCTFVRATQFYAVCDTPAAAGSREYFQECAAAARN